MFQSLGIVPHIPFLRRYSRILTGSQQNGDAYVAVLLESIIADPSAFETASDVRVKLYEQFCKLWESVSYNLSGALAQGDELEPDPDAVPLSPKAREAYLLHAVEGFTESQVAEILAADPAMVRDLIGEAILSITGLKSANVLIIEDEPLIAMDIEDILHSLGHKPVGIARTASQAIELAGMKKPDLILADIQLADGSSGIDAVESIFRIRRVPVVYITAFPERLLTGERLEPIFLISKPYMPDMVKAVISQALGFKRRSRAVAA